MGAGPQKALLRFSGWGLEPAMEVGFNPMASDLINCACIMKIPVTPADTQTRGSLLAGGRADVPRGLHTRAPGGTSEALCSLPDLPMWVSSLCILYNKTVAGRSPELCLERMIRPGEGSRKPLSS